MSAHFSPIMIDGALVLPATMLRHDRGVGHAQPLDAVHAQPRIDHGVDVAAHAAGADRMQV